MKDKLNYMDRKEGNETKIVGEVKLVRSVNPKKYHKIPTLSTTTGTAILLGAAVLITHWSSQLSCRNDPHKNLTFNAHTLIPLASCTISMHWDILHSRTFALT